jgi:hypothetical protein
LIPALSILVQKILLCMPPSPAARGFFFIAFRELFGIDSENTIVLILFYFIQLNFLLAYLLFILTNIIFLTEINFFC